MHQRRLYLLILGLLFSACGASARIVHVDARSKTPASGGPAWSSALPAISMGIGAALPGDEVWVAAGIYRERLILKPGVGLYGGFVGTESYRSQRLGNPGLTVLDGKLGNPIVTVQPNAPRETVLDGFTIRNGRNANTGGSGSIYCLGSPTISHNVIVANSTDEKGAYPGGGILCAGGSPLIRDNFIVGNSGNGAGIAIQSAAPRIVNNTLSANGGSAIAFLSTANAETVIANNVIAGNLTGISLIVPGAAIHRNLFWDNAMGDVLMNRQPTALPPDNLVADPMFVDAGHGQFHIQPSSPCVDAGDSSLAEESQADIDLLPRRMGQAVDIGADESDGRIWPAPFVPVVYVSRTPNNVRDGLSWATAKTTVQEGIDLAADLGGGEVWVAGGEYSAPVPYQPMRYTFVLRPFVHVYGGFAGTETGREERDWNEHPTILYQAPSASVVGVLSGHRAATLDGFVLLGTQTAPVPLGGGVSCVYASAVIRNNAILSILGSGVSSYNSAPIIEWNAIRGNSLLSGSGGGIYGENAAPVIRNNIIAANFWLCVIFDDGRSSG